ncbi:DNA-binding protein, partial [Xenorhabdus sp. XENO-7]|nr:DNA-binding protein [Xenorhabdus aichiensis]
TAMAKYFPRPIGGRIDWRGLSNFKLMWKVSKAAIIYRAHQLSLLSDAQYKTAFLGLKRKGEAIDEKEDYLIQHEKPELFHRAIKVLLDDLNIDIRSLAQSLSITPAMLIELANDDLLTCSNQEICSENVVSMFAYRNKMA